MALDPVAAIRLDVQQGTIEWVNARLGIPTASQFTRILSPKELKFSASATKYALELLAEEALRIPLEGESSAFMQRGDWAPRSSAIPFTACPTMRS